MKRLMGWERDCQRVLWPLEKNLLMARSYPIDGPYPSAAGLLPSIFVFLIVQQDEIPHGSKEFFDPWKNSVDGSFPYAPVCFHFRFCSMTEEKIARPLKRQWLSDVWTKIKNLFKIRLQVVNPSVACLVLFLICSLPRKRWDEMRWIPHGPK